ncbi:Lycopene cyclase protein [Bernardetia litoralis DSM 6794]|uniref:Lycopene cyclase protein n=1 Tax=Bernardetia litoralis (strain ATCC 23117 / DSM 6794 / NBRC 15988 / NCIMB 1366 / Fx l1 / Sio-4) TaxID=880071 RepID=I4AKI4_BERLS|nr:lycopene cyclase family protein [Bernardetia litoralis]AFM04469.1 Lycopene cyclase protein [Bernardetia litoralis DSM 6794]
MDYDIIFTGGGAAALILLYKLSKDENLSQKKILVIDKEKKNINNRSWSFWTNQKTDFDKIVYKEWQKVRFIAPKIDKIDTLNSLKYKMIRGIDFYNFVNARLSKFENIEFLQAEVSEIKSISDTEAEVKLTSEFENRIFKTEYIFDSRFTKEDIPPKSNEYHSLLQHFFGYVIETDEPIFDTKVAQLFDMRLPQRNAVEFVYILPFSPTKALVEYTLFSGQLLENKEFYKVRLESYITTKIKVKDFKILEEEYGVIPMTDFKFEQSKAKNIIYLGTKAGRAKPSTGYAFLRMYRDAENRINAWQKTGKPHYEEKFNKQFETYDKMILNIMERNPEDIQRIFTEMFQNNSIERVLLFLDEQTDFLTDLKIMASVPSAPFLTSIKNLVTGKKGEKLH